MTSQTRRISGAPHSFHWAACYAHPHLGARVSHGPVSRDAREVEKPASPPPLLAGLHAGPLPRAENLGRTRPLDASPGHGVALSPSAEGQLLECPSAGGMVGPGSPRDLAAPQ